MKKYFLIAVVAIALMVLHIPRALAAASNANLTAAYEAYYDFLQDEIYNVGKPIKEVYPEMATYPTVTEWVSGGASYAKLLDVDADGIPELFYGKKLGSPGISAARANMLLTYKSGKLMQYAMNSSLIDLTVSGNGLMWSVRVTKSADGKTYILQTNYSTNNEGYIFYGFNNGEWRVAQDLESHFTPDFEIRGDIHAQSTTGKWTYRISEHRINMENRGKAVSEQTLEATKQRYMQGGDEIVVLDEGFDTVVAHLEQCIPEYARAYHSAYNNPAIWAAPVVNEAIAAGVVPKELQTAYNRPITRAEFCALAVSYYEKVTNKSISAWASFKDTHDENVSKMAGLGVVTGVGNEKFDPHGTLTREQAATILARLSAALGNPIESTAPTFSDNNIVSSWAQDSVGQMQATGIMGGVGGNRFDPQAPYTKEQSIITVKRMDSRLVSATGLTLAVGESQLPIPLGSNAVAFITAGKNVNITPEFSPKNTTNKTLTWTSSNDSVISAEGTGVGAGTATLTATTENGISASVVIAVRDNFVTDKLPLTVDCIYETSWVGSKDFAIGEPLKADARDAGSVQIINVEAKTYSTDISSVKKQYCDIVVTGKVSRIREGVDKFYPYVKLILKDYDGNVLASKISGTADKKQGDEIEIKYTRIEIPDCWGAYTIELVSDKGRSTSDVISSVPKVIVPDLPFTLIGHTTVPSDLGPQKWKMIEVETMSISSIKVEIGDYDVKHDTYSVNLLCSGYVQYPYVNDTSAPKYVRWEIRDSTGELVDLGSFRAPDLEYDKANDPQKISFDKQKMNSWEIELKAGETYTLIIKES